MENDMDLAEARIWFKVLYTCFDGKTGLEQTTWKT